MTDIFDPSPVSAVSPVAADNTSGALIMTLLNRAGHLALPRDLSLQDFNIFAEPSMWLVYLIMKKIEPSQLQDSEGMDGPVTQAFTYAWRESFRLYAEPAVLEGFVADFKRRFLYLGRSLLRHPTARLGHDVSYLREIRGELVDAERATQQLTIRAFQGEESQKKALEQAHATRVAPLPHLTMMLAMNIQRIRLPASSQPASPTKTDASAPSPTKIADTVTSPTISAPAITTTGAAKKQGDRGRKARRERSASLRAARASIDRTGGPPVLATPTSATILHGSPSRNDSVGAGSPMRSASRIAEGSATASPRAERPGSPSHGNKAEKQRNKAPQAKRGRRRGW